jgi:acyl-coenzyme A synthetase/AMP-(fatty) acid ligase
MLRQRQTSDNLLASFLNHVEHSPDKIAIIYNDATLTYKEFEETIRRIASSLKHHYGPVFYSNQETPVLIGIICHSKLQALCCEFAVLALGAVFVPFHFYDAKKRQEFMIEKSGISLMLTDDNQYEINDSLTYFNVARFFSKDESLKQAILDQGRPEQFIYSDANPHDLAYVLFTSGSTAQNPKGVMRSRLSLYNQMACDYTKDLNITKEDCLLNLAIFTHDQAIVDCFAALLNGCTLCLYDAEDMGVENLHHFMRKNQVSIFSSIPSMFSIIFENVNKSMFPSLRVVTIGGEETHVSHALLYKKTCPDDCVLINGYGATEISWVASYAINHKTDLTLMHAIPLGYLTQSVKMKLIPIDDENNTSEMLYELCIVSDDLSSGYLNDKEATAQAFFRDQENNACYRSGDIVRLDENNCIQYKGRKSWHEKISGKRINLHEVENILRFYFENCAVIAFGEGERKKLYAFYTVIMQENNFAEMNMQLGQLLEKHMIPRYILLNEMPILQNGKINRQALRGMLEEQANLFEASVNEIKELEKSPILITVLEGFWREMLEIPISVPLDKNASFKEGGGSSQLALHLINKIHHYFKECHGLSLKLDPNVLYEDGETFEAFSNYIIDLYAQIKQQTQEIVSYPAPSIKEVHVNLAYHNIKTSSGNIKHYEGYYDESEKTKIYCIDYDFVALKMLTAHFNNEYNIHIKVCESQQLLFETISDFINDEESPTQIGLILFQKNNIYMHNYPCVLRKNSENNQVSLLVADGMQGFHVLGYSLNEIVDIKDSFSNLDIRFDLTGRQIDLNSCWTDTLLYLRAALQCDMLRQSTFLQETLNDASSFKGREKYRHHVGGLDVPRQLMHCYLFISPIETFYHSNLINLPKVAKITPSPEISSLIAKLGENEEVKNSSVDCYFVLPKLFYRMTLKCNTAVWRASYDFKLIIESILENQRRSELHKNQNPDYPGGDFARFFNMPIDSANPPDNSGNDSENRAENGKKKPSL